MTQNSHTALTSRPIILFLFLITLTSIGRSQLSLTDSAILKGVQPPFSYNGLHYSNDCSDSGNIKPYDALLALEKSLNDSIAATGKRSFKRKAAFVNNTLESLRWMKCLVIKNEFTIVVNIPSATLFLFKGDSIILESKAVVGKKTTRTPLVASFLTDITLYPYWMVPKSIATKELLPEIKKNINYLEQNNFQILDLNGRIVNPYTIDWQQLSRSYFPYIIRQSTGCDNSLGLIKLNINNPFNVYLHDTPVKALFASKNRFFSHGCIRVEEAKKLSHFLLKENAVAVDTLNENEVGLNHNPIVLKLKEKVPVIVLYNPAWFSMDGEIAFYSDIYAKFTNY